MFPFIFKGVKYETCTMKDSNANWCYTEVDANGVGIQGKWGNCGPGCKSNNGKVIVQCVYAITSFIFEYIFKSIHQLYIPKFHDTRV